VTELAQHTTEYGVVESESPEQLARNLNAAGHLLASATAFFFLAFVFAYFYLRSLNNAGLWHPKHVDPSQTLGALVMVAGVLTAVLVRWGFADHRAERRPAWRVKGAVALAFGIAAVVLQVVEWTTVGFGPADGGYASVFFGWTGFYVVFLVGALFWLETVLATSIRYRGWTSGERTVAAGDASGDRRRPGEDIRDPVSLVRAGLDALSFYWSFLAGVGVLAWILLYLA
jgi:heme/copper-type cytochrome/quinol oxidase subunit 3